VLLLLAVVVMSTAASGRLQASAKADFALTSSPTTVTAQQGGVASYTVTEQKNNGFTSPVTLSASNLPSGSSATFSPQTLDTKTTSTFGVAVGAATTPGTYSNVMVTGTSGALSHPITVTLVVTAAPTPSFTVSASPSSATMLPGNTAAYTVSTTALNGFTGSISFGVAGTPTGATATFSPTSVAVGGSSSLQVATRNTTAAGNYSLTITGTSGTKQQQVVVALVITSTGKQFTITAPSVTVPGPGAGVRLNLSISNPNSQPLQVTNLTVAITSVTKDANAPANLPCNATDYSIGQFSGSYPLTVGAGQTVSLSGLGVPSSAWPLLSMLNASSNQDGCKSASLSLAFSGAGQG
jgi:hypothetical protein